MEQKIGSAKGWPFEEAEKLIERFTPETPFEKPVIFETGYGPSGLPHIGTFGEVLRTTFVRRAFETLTKRPTRLICFSDDMDGLRKVPTNIPNQEAMAKHIGKPLTAVPDPFGLYESFAHHNNARLRLFLDSFGFEYEFFSATDCYQKGLFDAALMDVLKHHQAILEVVLPTLGPERRATYSPFLPLCPSTGHVLQVAVEEYRMNDGTIIYRNSENHLIEVPVTGGHCKLQWKADWGMRWAALGVDYEMSGKDLIDSVKLSSKICRILGKSPPQNFSYELFLDQNAQKISKSKGNGLTLEEWLTYAPAESLAYFMYQTPRRAKRLSFDVIPRCVDDYLSHLEKFEKELPIQQQENPVWHIHQGKPPAIHIPLSFSMLLNLASVCHAADTPVLWGFISRYVPQLSLGVVPFFDQLVECAVRYYQDFVAPYKKYREPLPHEEAALKDLSDALSDGPQDPESLQKCVYEIGKRHPFPDLKAWFHSLYQLLLGQEEGPRMGSFIALYGVFETQQLIEMVLNRKKESSHD